MIVVLDTNVVLDWLLFENASMAAWPAGLAAGRWRWIACAGMRDELAHVLERGLAAQHGRDTASLLAAWDRWVHTVPDASVPPAHRLHCTDPDDQCFIDLAQSAGAQWLLTRDRALLKLARRARTHGVEVATPERWAVSGSAAAPRT